jgi:hypothetical protein
MDGLVEAAVAERLTAVRQSSVPATVQPSVKQRRRVSDPIASPPTVKSTTVIRYRPIWSQTPPVSTPVSSRSMRPSLQWLPLNGVARIQ